MQFAVIVVVGKIISFKIIPLVSGQKYMQMGVVYSVNLWYRMKSMQEMLIKGQKYSSLMFTEPDSSLSGENTKCDYTMKC